MSILDEIIARKKLEVAAAKRDMPHDRVREAALTAEPPRDFVRSLRDVVSRSGFSIIAEIKRQSPSAGLIRPEYAGGGFAPEHIATRYHGAGAGAISCLTDEHSFGGHLSFIGRVKSRVPLPVLRKDFLVDPYQIDESRAAQADALLLIAECLPDVQLEELHAHARSLAMGVLVEVHDASNLARVRTILGDAPQSTLIGINNRNLRTMHVNLSHTLSLLALAGDPDRVVSESGIRSRADLDLLAASGVRLALVGEHLMREADPGIALSNLLDAPHPGGE